MSNRRRRERPIKRTNPSGAEVWVARYTTLEGKRKSAGTFKLKGPCKAADPTTAGPPRECCAQHAIDAAYLNEEAQAVAPAELAGETLADYAGIWPDRHPRPPQTADSHATRLRTLLKIPVEGRPLGEWRYRDLRPRHMDRAFDHMLRVEGRSHKGAIGIRNTASAMTQDAKKDEVVEINFAMGVTVRANDPRIQKRPKRIRIFTFDHLREFAAAGRAEVRKATPKPEKHKRTGEALYYSPVSYEAVLATLCLANFRIGEVFALLRTEMDLEGLLFHPTGSAYKGVITRGDTHEKKHEGENPIAPSLAAILRDYPLRIDTPLLFPNPSGGVWWDRTFRRDVWEPAQLASGIDLRPHEARHSYVSHLRAAGVDPADLAAVTRHTIQTATAHYTHATNQSHDLIRKVIG
jgi:integrase